jgi:hypothetical protein
MPLQLRAHGVRVLTVRDILAYNVEENVSARVDLEDLAFTALEYEVREEKHSIELSYHLMSSYGPSYLVRWMQAGSWRIWMMQIGSTLVMTISERWWSICQYLNSSTQS